MTFVYRSPFSDFGPERAGDPARRAAREKRPSALRRSPRNSGPGGQKGSPIFASSGSPRCSASAPRRRPPCRPTPEPRCSERVAGLRGLRLSHHPGVEITELFTVFWGISPVYGDLGGGLRVVLFPEYVWIVNVLLCCVVGLLVLRPRCDVRPFSYLRFRKCQSRVWTNLKRVGGPLRYASK